MRDPYRVTSQSFNHMHQKLLMQAMSWYHIYDDVNTKKLEDFSKIFDTARTAVGLTNYREGLEDCLNGVPGSLYSCRGGLESAGLIVRVVVKCTYDETKVEHRDCLTPFGSMVYDLIKYWEECALDEAEGRIKFPDDMRGECIK